LIFFIFYFFCYEDGCSGASDGGLLLLMSFPPFHHLLTHAPSLQIKNMEISFFLSFKESIF
jgi:hypothetical protein